VELCDFFPFSCLSGIIDTLLVHRRVSEVIADHMSVWCDASNLLSVSYASSVIMSSVFTRNSCTGIKFGFPLQNAQFLPLCTNLAREWLQIDTDLLFIITSTADSFQGVPTSMTLNDFEPEKYGFLVNFFSRFEASAHISWVNCIKLEITGDRPRHPANEIFSIKRRF